MSATALRLQNNAAKKRRQDRHLRARPIDSSSASSSSTRPHPTRNLLFSSAQACLLCAVAKQSSSGNQSVFVCVAGLSSFKLAISGVGFRLLLAGFEDLVIEGSRVLRGFLSVHITGYSNAKTHVKASTF